MTTQNAKISRRSNRSAHHLNREGTDSFTPRRRDSSPRLVGAQNDRKERVRNDKRKVAQNDSARCLYSWQRLQ